MSGLGTNPIVCSSGALMTNYARIGHAAQQVFPDILQDIIAIKEPQHRLYGDVTSNRYLNRNLRADEWSMINNVRTNGYVNFDIPLIYKLVRNLNLVPPPSNGWDFKTPPAANEILPGDDIERIRRTRNEILHRGNSQVSDFNLTDYFTAFKDIAIRLEIYLGKPKGEFVQKFQNLENCCMDEDTEKTYLESLTILRERDINLSKAVEDIQKDLDSILYKEIHQIEIEEWEEQNKLFIRTDAVDFVLESLKEKNCCTVIGTSGIGKSATIHHVALFLRDTEGYRIIPIHSPSEIDNYFQRNRRQIFVIDDLCGKYTVIQTEVEEWIKRNESIQRVFTYDNIKIIASSRIQVFNENQFKRLKLFTENFCNLSSDNFYLSYQVKLQIARQYLTELAVEHIKNDLDKYEFLPLLFALYKSLCKENENLDVVKFFKKPFKIYTEEIDALHLLFDKTKFCALFFLVISNGSINVSLLTNCESEQKRQKREDFFEDCGIPRNTPRQRILEQLESLVPLFVRSNYDLSRQITSFSAIHDKTFDFLCFYFGKKFQKSFLQFADREMLYERTVLKSLISPDKTVEDFTIWITDVNEDEYFRRVIDQWSMGDLVSLFYSRQMSLEKCRYKLIDYLNRLPADRRRELITLSIEKKESFVQFIYWSDGCSGLLPLSPLSLAFKRNFFDLIRYILNFIKDTKGGGFSILLIKACSAGLTDVVNKFINKGSDIHVTDMDGLTPLIASCKHANSDIVRLLIEKGADVNVCCKLGLTPLLWACKLDNSDIVRLLVEKGADLNLSDGDGHTPLIWQCKHDNDDIVRLMVERGANVNSSDGDTPLIWSCRHDNRDIVRLLVEHGANVNVSDGDGDTPILWSCRHVNTDIVRLLIEKGAEINVSCELGLTYIVRLLIEKEAGVNVSDITGETPLSLSCKKDDSDFVRLLIEKGAVVNATYRDGETPLTLSSKYNNSAMIRLLIDKGAKVNVSNMDEENPLILSCKYNNSDMIRLLIEKGAQVNLSDKRGLTPLIWSCYKDNSDIILLLIEKRANVNVSDKNKDTPLILSCKNNNSDIIQSLIEKGANINVSNMNGETPLLWSCRTNNGDIVRLLIEKGANINVSNMNGETPLIWSCRNNNTDIVRFLIENGTDIKVSEMIRETPLLWSCRTNNGDIVRLLIEKGANTNVSNMFGETPLIWSCRNNNSDLVRLLIEKEANINASNIIRETPLIWSCKNNNSDLVRFLIENGANVNESNESLKTPLIWACNNDNSDIIRLLIEKGADINVYDRYRQTPFILSCRNNNSDIVRLLIENGANVNESAINGNSPLLWSCRNNNSDIVRYLIEKGADINVYNEYRQTPLILSCYKNNSDIVRLLIEKGASINVSEMNGETPLKMACYNSNSDIARLLIVKGAYINVSKMNGETPLIWSCKNNKCDIVQLLIEKGAEINLCDYDGMTALSYASKKGFFEIVEELTLNGADVHLTDINGKTPLIYANENEDHKIENFLSKHLYRLHIFDRKRKISEHETVTEVNYEGVAKYLKIENDKH